MGVSTVTMEIANRAAKAGHEVLISHMRNNNIIKDAVSRMGDHVILASKDRVLKTKIIILFAALEDIQNLMSELPDMTGKILIHTNNAILGKEFPGSVSGKSSGEIIASLLPEASIIRMYSIIGPSICMLKNPDQEGNQIFYSGDAISAKRKVKSFFETLGLEAIDIEISDNKTVAFEKQYDSV
ncbi:NAD(P)-binding domain-containing protein [Flavobacterium daemonense]|uniref:NAD(P)-binding domain-containing protein n=1 Tax=Flavobacterium daemonense TaxID=1393049 RepID=UPI0011866150|nr:NAD(P)-binding domain-containing protein [Flavobacterium daemonense]KAF2330665.1 NAD(P)-binding domain-containing protein [Flavobacterium daemonense]